MESMRIEIDRHNDRYYESWETYYEWDGKRWVYHDEGIENESGMMGAFNRSQYHEIRAELTKKDNLAILKHFRLTPEDVPLNKVPNSSPKYLQRVFREKNPDPS